VIFTICGLAPPLSEMLMVSEYDVPVSVEVNCTVKVQLPFWATALPLRQVLWAGEATYGSTANCAAPVPVIVGVPLNVSDVVPLLVTVNVTFFVVPAGPVTVPKASAAGDKLTSVAVAVNGNTNEVLVASPENVAVTFPGTLPSCEVLGENSTLK